MIQKNNIPNFWNKEDLLLEESFQKELGVLGIHIPNTEEIHKHLIEHARPICQDDINSLKMFMPSIEEAYLQIMNGKTIIDINHNVKHLFFSGPSFFHGEQAKINYEELISSNVSFFKNEDLFHHLEKIDSELFQFKPLISYLEEFEENECKKKLKGKKSPSGRSNKQHLNILNLNKKRRH